MNTKFMTMQIKRHLKIVAALCAAVAVSAAAVGSSFAWFSKNAQQANTFHVAASHVSVTEVFNPPKDWKPDEPVTKKVSFTNDGQVDVYIRVPAPAETWTAADGSYLSSQYLGADKKTHDVAQKHFTNAWNQQWVKSGDYFYYCKILKAGEKTEIIMDSVTLATDLPDVKAYADAQYQLKFTVENVQALPEAAKEVWQMQPTVDSTGSLTWSPAQTASKNG